MPLVNKALFVFLLLSCTIPAAAQKLTFQQLGVRQGLPASEVYNLYQDKKGYVWAFTEYGIVRHNGTRFVPVCRGLPFDENAIYRVAESPEGELYLANSQARIYKIVHDSAQLVRGLEQVSADIMAANQIILDLLIDDSSNIWFSTHVSSYKHSLVTGKTEQICEGEKNAITFRDIGKGTIVLKCMNTEKAMLYRIRVKDATSHILFDRLSPGLTEGRNSMIHTGNRYYLMLANSVILLQPGKPPKEVFFSHPTLNMRLAPNGHIWMAMAYDGLYELDAGLNTIAHYLDNLAISDVLFDRHNGIWISSIGSGVFYCRNGQSISYNEFPELSEGITLLRKVHGKLFIGTMRGDLFVRENNRLRKVELEGNGKAAINALLFHEGSYFIGTKSALFRANEALTDIVELRKSNNLSAYALAEGKNGGLLIVSASRICEKKAGENPITDRMNAQKPRLIAVRKDGTVFIGSRIGLFSMERTLVCPAYLQQLRGKNIARLYVDGAQNTWICTKGDGLFCLTAANRLQHFRDVPSEVIIDILFLSHNRVLLATNRGTFMSYLLKGRVTSWIQLNDEETISMEWDDDKLYLGTKLGLTILDVKRLSERFVYPFYLKSVLSEGRPVDPRLSLSHTQKNLVFNFDLLAYQLDEKRLFYRLEGPTPGRGIVNGTQLQLQNLAPGQYVLRVYPTNYFMNSNQEGQVCAFYIAPAFWQTHAFFGSIVFLSVTLIIGILWIIFARISRKAEERSRITKLLAGYRLTALKAQINPHFISNSLAAIQQLVLTDESYKANQYLAKFSLLIRYLLDYSDESVASLANEIRIIELIIELEQLRFSHKFVFRKEISDAISMDEVFIPPLITQPFIENAIWHGLLPLNGEREPELVLRVENENGHLVISIIDNGVGRSASAGNHTDGHISKGTELIQGRIENLNRLHAATGARIQLIDREDGEGKPAGLEVRIIFPFDMLNTLYNEQDQEYYY